MPTSKFSDLYRPEWFIDFAEGYYARVFRAHDLAKGGEVAFKVLRPEHLEDGKEGKEYNAFGLEARLLHHLRDCKTVVKLFDCGFVSDRTPLPTQGEIISLGDDVDTFNGLLSKFRKRKWRPYLCEALKPEPQNLFVLLKENTQRRRRLPTEEAIALARKYTDLLQRAHADEIVYLDVKLEHFYWRDGHLSVIDWNSSRLLSDPANQDEDHELLKQNDIRNFAIGVMYPILTGVSAVGDFRAMPSSSDAVDKRYQNVNELDFRMEPALAKELVGLIRAAAFGDFSTIEQFQAALDACSYHHGWQVGDQQAPASAQQARCAMRKGLSALHRAQSEIQRARSEMIAALEEADPRLDAEIERLIQEIDEFWERRVLP
jgi:serine/threonine protein kinase